MDKPCMDKKQSVIQRIANANDKSHSVLGKPIMTRLHLKLIASVSMLADHICKVFFAGSLGGMIIDQSFGRLAFPLFMFMLCRGYFFTRSRLRYGISMLITAIISEPVYDYLFYNKLVYFQNQNVVFTLLTTLIMLVLIEKTASSLPLQILIAACFAAAAQLLHFDYGAAGIAMGFIYYLTRNEDAYKSCAIACIPLVLVFGIVGTWLSAFVLWYYNETRERLSSFAKYFFYVFYPGHLCLLLATYLIK